MVLFGVEQKEHFLQLRTKSGSSFVVRFVQEGGSFQKSILFVFCLFVYLCACSSCLKRNSTTNRRTPVVQEEAEEPLCSFKKKRRARMVQKRRAAAQKNSSRRTPDGSFQEKNGAVLLETTKDLFQ